MSFGEYMKILLGVISDWRVLVSLFVMILVHSFTRFLMNYKKKPKVPKAKKEVVKEEKPAPEAKAEEEEE